MALASAAFAVEPDVKELVEQNRLLQEQVRAQQKQIDELRVRLDRIDEPAPAPTGAASASSDRQVRISGEAGLGFFRSNQEGTQPNSEFRVDDAKVFVEAAIWKNVYLFGGLELTTREANDEYFHLGELYMDVEGLWRGDRNHVLSLRAGRMNLPFGEEYQYRNVVDNPLVTHSATDIWGIDEGVQLYGTYGPVRYNLAVLNGGHKTMRDFDPDKSVVVRLGFDATPRLALSASAMRTGDLSVAGDGYSEVWIANAFFRQLGPAATTRTFWADLAEVDATYRWSGGHLHGMLGRVNFDDDNATADNSRHLTYYGLEGVQEFGEGFFVAARYSAIDAPRGYPLTGLSGAGEYFYNPYAPLTKDLRRLSLGLGYRFSPPLVWKFEYSHETSHLLDGSSRGDVNMLSSLLGLRF